MNTAALPRVRPVWEALQAALLAVSSLHELAGGVVIEGDGYTDPDQAPQWGRLVLAPLGLGAPIDWRGDGRIDVALVLRAEQPALDQPGYVPAHGLEAMLGAAHAVLDGWAGPVASLSRVIFPFYLVRAPQAAPLYEAARRIWWLSSEYRGELVHLPGE